MRHLVYRKTIILFIAFFPTLSAVAATSEYSVTHFTNENGLPQNSIRGVELDKEGFVWLATEAGLVRFDGQYFKLYDRDHYPLLQSNRITHLSLDTTGTICFRDEFYNAYTFDRKGRLLSIPKQAYKARAIFFSKSQFLLLSDTLHYRNTKWEMTLPVPSYHSKLGRWGQLNYNCYYKDKWGEIWCVDTARNVKKVRITGLLTHLRSFTKTNQSYSLYPHGNELYLHAGKGIYRLSEGLSGVLKATLVLETDVPEIQFYRNYPDLNLQLIGTQTQGVYIFRRKQFTTLRHDNKNSNHYPQVPLGDSGVLTDRGPVYPFFARPDYPFKNAITYRSLLRDKLRRYWINKSINNRNDKIVLLDSQLRVLKTLTTIYTANCFRETPDGHIWMCSFQGDRMGYAHNDSVQWLPALWGHDTSALTFLPIDNETFWIGGMHIFAKFNVKSRQLLHFKSLEGYIIETLYLDKQNILWIGTSGNGFYALKQGKIYAFPLDKNAGLKNVHTFMEDKTGFMWMTTNNGLFRCKRKDLDNFLAGKVKDIYYQCFKKESGFNTNEFNGSCTPSGIVLGNGKFSLPSIDGLVQFYPDSIREPLSDKKIFIDKFLVDGKEKDLANFIELQPSFQRIEIEVASPYFGLYDNQKLECNVKGLDQNWYPVNNNKIVLNRFPYGSYTLQLRKRAGFGMNNFITTSLNFNVIPFFYQTWYFKLGLILVAGLLIFLFVKIRYTYLLKRNKELEQVIIQRTAHLDNANRLKEKMLMMVGHDLQSPLHFLGHLSKINAEAVALKQHDRIEQVSQHINSTTQKISTFVEEFSLWARVQDEAFNLRKTTFPISALIGDLQHFSKDILQFNGNVLECDVDNDYLLYTNVELLKAVLRNLIDNANKHTKNGLIKVSCVNRNNTCVITIADNGEGISEERLKRIKGLILKAKHTTLLEPANGRLGYQFIADFATRLQADISISSVLDKGTTVCLSGITISVSPHEPEKQFT